jgi:hypothetical protein
MRARAPVSLNVIHVAKPCPADWEKMHGDARVRFCDECRLHVYNLSELTRPQAEKLVSQHEGRLCVRYYQRADGTVITQDCGGGMRRAMQRTRTLVTAVAATVLCAMLSPFGFGSSFSRLLTAESDQPGPQQREVQGKMAVMGDVAAPPPQPPVVMGVVAPRPPATQPTTQPAQTAATQPAN